MRSIIVFIINDMCSCRLEKELIPRSQRHQRLGIGPHSNPPVRMKIAKLKVKSRTRFDEGRRKRRRRYMKKKMGNSMMHDDDDTENDLSSLPEI